MKSMIVLRPLNAVASSPALRSLALSLVLAGSASAAPLLEDNFDDNSLDSAHWSTNLIIPQGGASVTEQNQRMELVARGHLVTAEQYDPVALGGIRLTGQWTFVSGDDFMQVLTRTDGLPAGQYGETANGIEFLVALTNATKVVEIRTRNAASIQVTQDAAGVINAAGGMTFDFEIIDNGAGGLSFTMTETGDPANTATTTATVVSDNFDLNHVAFHNRESAARTAYLDNVVISTLEDTDGDGLPDDWEIAHELDPNDDGTKGESAPGAKDGPNGSDGDPDMDGSGNFEEFTNGTDPKKADSDEDGVNDGDEVAKGTNPLASDTDRDGLSDGVETDTGIFNGPSDTGTDPLNADSDGDGFRDGTEVNNGSDPNNPLSKPADSSLPIIDDFEDGVLDELVWTTDLNIPQGGAAVREQGGRAELVARGHLVTAGQFDPANGGLRITGRWTFGSGDDFMQVLTRTDGLPGGQWGETTNGIEFFVALTNATKVVEIRSRNGASIQVVQDEAGSINAAGGMTFDFEIIDDGAGGLSFTMTETGNPANSATTTATVVSDDFELNHIAFHNRESSGRTAYLEEVAIERLSNAPGVRLTDLRHDAGANTLSIRWESAAGQLYNLRSETGLSGDPATWPIFGGQADLVATPPENSLTIPFPADAERFFVIEAFPVPPVKVFSDDFENGVGSWMTAESGVPFPPAGDLSAPTATKWELGTPDPGVVGGPPAAKSGAKCFGTDLDAAYEVDSGISLRSPTIDLTNFVGGTLVYWRFVDIESNFDYGRIRLLDAADDSEIAVLENVIDGTSADWEEVRIDLPAAAAGKSVKIEFSFAADDVDLDAQAGFYLDDICVEAVPE